MSGYVAQHGQPAGFNSHDQEWAQLPQLLASLRNPYPQGPRPSPVHYHLDRVRTGGSSENWTLSPRVFVNECPTESAEGGMRLELHGTVATVLSGTLYQTPVRIQLPFKYPLTPPLVKLDPPAPVYGATTAIIINKVYYESTVNPKVSRATKELSLDYLRDWSPAESNLETLLVTLKSTFSSRGPMSEERLPQPVTPQPQWQPQQWQQQQQQQQPYPGQPGYPGPGYPGPGYPGQQPGYPGQQPGYPGQSPYTGQPVLAPPPPFLPGAQRQPQPQPQPQQRPSAQQPYNAEGHLRSLLAAKLAGELRARYSEVAAGIDEAGARGREAEAAGLTLEARAARCEVLGRGLAAQQAAYAAAGAAAEAWRGERARAPAAGSSLEEVALSQRDAWLLGQEAEREALLEAADSLTECYQQRLLSTADWLQGLRAAHKRSFVIRETLVRVNAQLDGERAAGGAGGMGGGGGGGSGSAMRM